MLRLLSCVEVCSPILRSSRPNYTLFDSISDCYQSDLPDFKPLLSKVKLTKPVEGHGCIKRIASRAKPLFDMKWNTSKKIRASATEHESGCLDVYGPSLYPTMTGQTFCKSRFLPRNAKVGSALCASNSCERTQWASNTQTQSRQTRCYSTCSLNSRRNSTTKFFALSSDFNLDGSPLWKSVRSKSTSSKGALETAEDVAAYISQEASSILVMTGAGLSTASGIPDFRSPGTGIYDNLQKYDLPYPEAIFDIQFFMMDPRPFVALAQELYPGLKFRPNAGHHFIRLLQDKGKLRRVYTQNIDGLERLSGIQENKLLEAHGSFAGASCTLCRTSHDPEQVKHSILSGPGVPICGVRGCKGKVKPDIVFFGENLPEEFWRFEEDLHAVDLLLIIGTSLEVYPFASIADSARNVTPRVLINMTAAGSIGMRPKDCILQGDIVETVSKLARLCGWQQELDERGRLA